MGKKKVFSHYSISSLLIKTSQLFSPHLKRSFLSFHLVVSFLFSSLHRTVEPHASSLISSHLVSPRLASSFDRKHNLVVIHNFSNLFSNTRNFYLSVVLVSYFLFILVQPFCDDRKGENLGCSCLFIERITS